jgi:hypothetical protein
LDFFVVVVETRFPAFSVQEFEIKWDQSDPVKRIEQQRKLLRERLGLDEALSQAPVDEADLIDVDDIQLHTAGTRIAAN